MVSRAKTDTAVVKEADGRACAVEIPGGDDCPSSLSPQQTRPRSPARIAQALSLPTLTFVYAPAGGVAIPPLFSPQHTTARSLARMAHVFSYPALTCV